MERWPAPGNIKKKIYKCYNYGIKEYLARDYRKSKTGPGPQKKQQALRKSQRQILVAEAISPQKKNHQLAVLKKQDTKVKILHSLIS